MSTTNDYKIAVIGPKDTVSGLKALGVEAFEATTTDEALEQLAVIKQTTLDVSTDAQYAIVCIIEDLVSSVDRDEYAKAVAGSLPAVVLLPGLAGSDGFALDRLRQLAEQAVGSAII